MDYLYYFINKVLICLLAGVKVGSQIEEKPDFQEFEVKLRYNDRLVKKVEFLELTFDAFKGCLTYSSKFRVASNFAQFYEGESAKIANTPRKASLKPVRGGPHLLYEEKGNDIPVSTNLKSLHSKISHVGYKNYVSEGVGIKMLDKKRSPAGLIKEREEYGINRSFY